MYSTTFDVLIEIFEGLSTSEPNNNNYRSKSNKRLH